MKSRHILFERGNEQQLLDEKNFETTFQVKPVFHLEFAKPKYKDILLRKCEKALKQGWITAHQVWLGTYYQKEIENAAIPNVYIRWIDNRKGFGVFANDWIGKKQFVGEYTGTIRKRKKKLDQTNSYCFEYVIGEGLDTKFTIDAKDVGNHIRFVNHSSKGNLDPMLVFSGGLMHVILYANRHIEKGEELTYDYGEDYWAKREAPVEL